MKTYKNLYEKLLDREYLKKCFRTAAKKKTRRADVRRILENLDEHVEILYQMLLHEEFIPAYHITKTIQETAARKARRIVKPNYKYEQVVHHAVVGQFGKIVEHGLYEQVCGSIKKRGTHSGSKTVEKWIRGYKGRKFYILKVDIRHFFETIDRDVLKAKLKKVIRDDRFLRLMFILIEYDRIGEAIHFLKKAGHVPTIEAQKQFASAIAYGRAGEALDMIDAFRPDPDLRENLKQIVTGKRTGVPLGYYTSQWLGNFYLKETDQLVVQELRPDHYIRYMDDMVFFSRNKRKLRRIREALDAHLKTELKVELKTNWQVFRFEYVGKDGRVQGRMLDFLGFQFHENRKTLRKSTLKGIRRKASRIGRKSKISWYEAAQMISYMGSIKHAAVYGYYRENIKEKINVRKLKKILSKHTRKENQKNEVKLQEIRKSDRTGASGSGKQPDDGLYSEKRPADAKRRRADRLPVRRSGPVPVTV